MDMKRSTSSLPDHVEPGYVNEVGTVPLRRVGYVVAIVINVVMFWIVDNILEWGWLGFLTQDFDELVPLIKLSIVASIVVNLIWLAKDPAWLKHLLQIPLNVISLIVGIRSWEVFPLDFSGYAVDWELIARIGLGFGIVVVTLATIAEFVNLIRTLTT